MSRVAGNTTSLIQDVDNNAAEHYNSVVAKFVGRKRLYYSLEDSYDIRCFAASLSFNSHGAYHDSIAAQVSGRKGRRYTSSFAKASARRQAERRKSRGKIKHLLPIVIKARKNDLNVLTRFTDCRTRSQMPFN
ncbi:hypothetical protein HPB48_007294 [Haemaphysalis longicornis]|uniref:Uncharacterized protein n=1 Tax=Haemaphysalis longicornis TaxID=44386 RepID=A0A9J6GY79_HAELO|nr:hypothetical protein HPB48_007294 [Haemaphysalis longicornis]